MIDRKTIGQILFEPAQPLPSAILPPAEYLEMRKMKAFSLHLLYLEDRVAQPTLILWRALIPWRAWWRRWALRRVTVFQTIFEAVGRLENVEPQISLGPANLPPDSHLILV